MKRHAHYGRLQGELTRLDELMRTRKGEYKKLRKALDDMRDVAAVTKTMLWQYIVSPTSEYPEDFFYATPPVVEARESNRILITGTRCETTDMYKILEGLETYRRVLRELQSRQPKQLIVAPAASSCEGTGLVSAVNALVPAAQSQEITCKPEYAFAAQVGSFWKSFFGEEHFLDCPQNNSIPMAILGTGYMRNYNRLGGETIDVSKRLEQIALDWNIPIQFIDSWAP